ncbi:putative chromosome partition protein [Staphylococcus aureus]|uniref:Putative chromosome partition protein n=1 Tax=Staphylococcus aureus TaxID=1280 RepID=A0A380DS01_STAAU|nr:putative chromosome partition protein [Staphylococcus aureus]
MNNRCARSYTTSLSPRYFSYRNHYQDIKAEQSKLDVLIHHAIDHLNDEYQLTVERAKTEYTMMNRLTHYVKKLNNEDVD